MRPHEFDPIRYAPWLQPAYLWAHAALDRLPPWPREFLVFGFKQGWAALFGGLMLTLIILTKLVWRPDWPIARYDALFLGAIAIQMIFLTLKLESWTEARVILIFHAAGTAMEIFKTAAGSWTYPEANLVRIAGVPLFSGFMYAAVGSYMVRAVRLFDMRFTDHPPVWMVLLLGVSIYVNFFTHHWTFDLRYLLFAWAVAIWWRTRIYFTIDRVRLWMPLLLAALLCSFFVWIAENVGTLTRTWRYAGQGDWELVSLTKMGSWYLLMILSYGLVCLVHRPKPL